jgi:hypothetical protein
MVSSGLKAIWKRIDGKSKILCKNRAKSLKIERLSFNGLNIEWLPFPGRNDPPVSFFVDCVKCEVNNSKIMKRFSQSIPRYLDIFYPVTG